MEGEIPVAITPEMILHGHELVSINVVPDLESDSDEWKPPGSPTSMFENLNKTRHKLMEVYSMDILPKLIAQATDVPNRYLPKSHNKLSVGDIVLIKDNFVKRANMPMAVVRQIESNSLGEITNVVIMKGSSRELMKRNVHCLIPVLSQSKSRTETAPEDVDVEQRTEFLNNRSGSSRPIRKAAAASSSRNQALAALNLR